jgi:two-component system cell cycle response regulator
MGGAAISMAVPAGLLLLRLASGAATSIYSDLMLNSLTYAYVMTASAVAIAAFGYSIGCRADVWQALATTDALTGLLNRRAIEKQIQLEWERARRYGLPLSLLMIDLDGLKCVNDVGGHSAGDRVLRGAATAISCTLRGSDFGGRWGGDEFVILAPHTSRESARQLAERVAARISQREWSNRVTTTASIGIVTLEQGASEETAPETLIDEADRALYAAKEGGRSRVMAS